MSALGTLLKINIISSFTLIIGLLNSLVIAAIFGLTGQLDAYFAALVVPQIFMSMIVDYLGKNFLPIYSQARKVSYEYASSVTTTVVMVMTFVAVIILGLILSFSNELFRMILPGFGAERLELVVAMFEIMAFSVVFMTINAFHEYILQYNEQYKKIMFSKMAVPISLMILLLVVQDGYGEKILPVAFLIGHFIAFILLAYRVDYTFSIRNILSNNDHVMKIFKNSALLMSTGLVGRARPLVERYFGSMLDGGGLSALSISNRLCRPISKTSTVGVKMMSFSKGSRLYADGKVNELCDLYTKASVLVLLIIVPIVTWLMVVSERLVNVLFVRGKFDQDMATLMTMALLGMLPAIIARSVNPIISNGYYVLDKIRVPMIVSPVSIIVLIISANLLVDDYGVLGMAIASSISFISAYLILLFMLGRYLENFSSAYILKKMSLYGLASVATFGGANGVMSLFSSSSVVVIPGDLIIGVLLYVLVLEIIKDSEYLLLRKKVLALRVNR